MKRLIYIIGFIFIIFVIIVIIVFLNLGKFLSPEDTLAKSDVIVVISGGGTERMEKGIELWNKELAPLILFSGASMDPDSPSNALVMKEVALQLGVDEENILIEEDSQNTYQNALETRNTLEENEISVKSLILVTSSYHQRRAFQNFRKVFSKEIEILNAPADVDFWNRDVWWETEESRRLTFIEMSKIFLGFVTGKSG